MYVCIDDNNPTGLLVAGALLNHNQLSTVTTENWLLNSMMTAKLDVNLLERDPKWHPPDSDVIKQITQV